jgi:hypothetical protein
MGKMMGQLHFVKEPLCELNRVRLVLALRGLAKVLPTNKQPHLPELGRLDSVNLKRVWITANVRQVVGRGPAAHKYEKHETFSLHTSEEV